MYFSKVTGHRSASLAIERALHELDSELQIETIDALNYTHPYCGKVILKTYEFIIKAIPRFWEYLYDNERVFKKLKGPRSIIHRLNEKKIKGLLSRLSPNAVVCTQAFPCVMLADYKQSCGSNIPLIGVLTDYAPHAYWLHDEVDTYVVPSGGIEQEFIRRGVPAEKIKVLGIPIDSRFSRQTDRRATFLKWGLDSNIPVILIMGGGQGLGPIKEIACTLDRLRCPVQLIVICGINRRLKNWFSKNRERFEKPLTIAGYVENVNELMDISTLVVTKAGGLTSTEALSRSLPMILVNPLPGQENLNTKFFMEKGVAVKADNFSQLFSQTEKLLSDDGRCEELRRRISAFAGLDSAAKIARLILRAIERQSVP